MSVRILAPAVAILLVALPGVALAQYQMVSPMLYYGPTKSLEDHANATRPDNGEPADRATELRPDVRSVPPRAALVSFTYRPDLKRRRDNLAQFANRNRAADPQGAAKMTALFAGGDFIERIQSAMAPYDVRIDNVADAYAIYWITAYQAMRGDAARPAKPIVAAVRAQAGQALTQSPSFATSDDAARQSLAESFWIQAALLGAALEEAQARPDQLPFVRSAAIQSATGMGLPLERMTLTDAGFVAAPVE